MVKVAILGCGTMGRAHLTGYAGMGNVRVTALCDLEEKRARERKKLCGNAAVYTNFAELLKKADFDVLDICLPTYLHQEYAVRAMEAGKHVFCEKPVALTLEEAQCMIDTAKRCGVKFSVGHVLRFFPAYRKAAALVESGRIGTPRLIRTTRNQAFPGWSWEGWYEAYEKSGGPIVDLIIHDLDWILHYIGKAERVFAQSFNGKVRGREHCMVILRLQNGCIAHVEGSWAYPAGTDFHTTLEVVGTDGQLEYDNLASAPVIRHANEKGVYRMQRFSPVQGQEEPCCAELAAFVRCVENNEPPSVTGEEALEALRVALAALESSKTGKPVKL